MKAAVVKKAHTIAYEEREMPKIAADEVLLKVNCFGVCASDMQVYSGKHKIAVFPLVMGHECCGTVWGRGAEVKEYEIGEMVAVQPQITCGQCWMCRNGYMNVCASRNTYGIHRDGFNQEYIAVKAAHLHHVDQHMHPETVCLVEPVAVGVGAARRSKLLDGGNALVIGSSIIGNVVAQACKILGAKKVMLAGRNSQKMAYALECGVDAVFSTKETGIKEAGESFFGSDGVDVIFDCAGVPAVLYEIVAAARPRSEIIVTANYKEPVELPMHVLQSKEIDLMGHLMYDRAIFAETISLLEAGKFNTQKLISQQYMFEAYEEGLRFYDSFPDEVMKMIVWMQGKGKV